MSDVILVACRGKEPERDRAWALLRAYYATGEWEIFVSDSPGERFNLNVARNLAARRAGKWDVAAFLNADCAIPIESIRRGFAHARKTGRVTVPWDHYYSMSDAGHGAGDDAAIPIGDPLAERRWRDGSHRWPEPAYFPGGDIIVPRAVFERIGGWDERFVSYAPEDAAMLLAAGEFDRLAGPAYHFWHPSGSPQYVEAENPWPEYRPIFQEGRFTQRLVDEGRDIHDFGSWTWA